MNTDVSTKDARAALEQVRAAEGFHETRLGTMLEYVVEETLNGRGDQLKGYTIALDVFKRSADFDSQSDSIVRVEMGRLRAALTNYYLTTGQTDPVQITIPKGRYVVEFSYRAPAGPQQTPDSPQDAVVSRRNATWVIGLCATALIMIGLGVAAIGRGGWFTEEPPINSVVVYPIKVQGEDAQKEQLAQTLSANLTRLLGNGGFLSVVEMEPSRGERQGSIVDKAAGLDVRFLLKGRMSSSAHPTGERAKITLSLVDLVTRVIVWTETYEVEPDNIAGDYQTLLRRISFDLNPAYYAAAKQIVEDGADAASPIELFLISNWVPGSAVSSLKWQLERVALARAALEVDPDFTPAHSVLADMLAYLATMDPLSDTPEAREQSIRHANIVLSSDDQQGDALFNIVNHNLHIGNIEKATAIARRTALLDPKNGMAQFYAIAMPYTCAPSSDEILAELVAFHDDLSLRNPVRWITATTIGRIELNRRNYAEAVRWGLVSAEIFQSLDAAYQLAAALVQTGDDETAREIIARQKELWPTLDADHFANVVIPRRCGDTPAGLHLQDVYRDLAAALEK